MITSKKIYNKNRIGRSSFVRCATRPPLPLSLLCCIFSSFCSSSTGQYLYTVMVVAVIVAVVIVVVVVALIVVVLEVVKIGYNIQQLVEQHLLEPPLLFCRWSCEFGSGRLSRGTKCITVVLPNGSPNAPSVTLQCRNLPW